MSKNPKSSWTSRKIVRAKEIIAAVQQRPILYDQSLIGVRRQCVKYGIATMKPWMEVAMFVYGRNDIATVERVRREWKTIRDGFVKYLRKRQFLPYLRPYSYESEMQFLQPHIYRNKNSESSINIIVYECEAVSEDENTAVDDTKEQTPFEHVIAEHDVEDVEVLEHHVQSIESFFEGVIQTVRKFKPSTVDRLKQQIANLVMDAEIEELEENMEL